MILLTRISLRKELDKVAKKYQPELLISPLPEMTIVSPVYRYILTLLRLQLSTELLTKLFRHLQERELHTTAVSPLDAEDLQVFAIKIHVDQPIDRQQLMQELLELKSEFQLDFSLQSDDLFRRNKRLIFLDADMTFIQCEMINDVSRLSGIETEIAEITNRAMDGDVNFK